MVLGLPGVPEQGLFCLGRDTVGHGVGDAPLFPAILEGLDDGGAVPVVFPGCLGQVAWMNGIRIPERGFCLT